MADLCGRFLAHARVYWFGNKIEMLSLSNQNTEPCALLRKMEMILEL